MRNVDNYIEVEYGKDDNDSVFLKVKDKRLIYDFSGHPFPDGIYFEAYTGSEGVGHSISNKAMGKLLQNYGVLATDISRLILEIDEKDDVVESEDDKCDCGKSDCRCEKY